MNNSMCLEESFGWWFSEDLKVSCHATTLCYEDFLEKKNDGASFLLIRQPTRRERSINSYFIVTTNNGGKKNYL